MIHQLYGSGDRGTAALKSLFAAKGVAYVFLDIRTTDAAGRRANLIYLQERNISTVPYEPSLGKYEAIEAFLMALPDPVAKPRTS